MSTTVSHTQSLLEQAIDLKPPLKPPDTPLKVAIAAMTQASASCVLIAVERQLLGILTERDVVNITAREIPLAGVAISEVMTQNPIAISLDKGGNIFKVLSILRSSSRAALTAKIRHMPVTDEGGNLLGAITSESIRQILKPGDLLQMRCAQEIMTTEVIVASTKTSVLEVAKQMATRRKSCIVICTDSDNKNQKPVGIITERDIVKFQAAGLDFAGTPATALSEFSPGAVAGKSYIVAGSPVHAAAPHPAFGGGGRGRIFSRNCDPKYPAARLRSGRNARECREESRKQLPKISRS